MASGPPREELLSMAPVFGIVALRALRGEPAGRHVLLLPPARPRGQQYHDPSQLPQRASRPYSGQRAPRAPLTPDRLE
ncbi:hypothetical protein QJS66_01775 [Kocuria rhizophila]|nr:hypothetical protein QJS66_01775 [Kocuria rhizophila]